MKTENNSIDHAKLDELYSKRKQQFVAPTSSHFLAKKTQPFWKSMGFYSSICALSLALVVVIPMIHSQKHSAISQAPPLKEYSPNLEDSERFMAKPLMAPMSDQAPLQKSSRSVNSNQNVMIEHSEKTTNNPCESQKNAANDMALDDHPLADQAPSTHTQIECQQY